jgi:hypothetical protein
LRPVFGEDYNLANISLPDNEELLEVAKAKTREYFKNFS